MSYWKWLGESVKEATSRKRIKAILPDPFQEMAIGLTCFSVFVVFGLVMGSSVSPACFLLLLGTIPSFLVMSHATYRRKMKDKAR